LNLSSPNYRIIYRCPKCGWTKTKHWKTKKCPKCGTLLKPITIKNPIIEYTDEYRDKHWIKCRYGKDLRDCGEWKLNPKTGQLEWKCGYYSKKVNGKWFHFCKKDNKKCDAKWTGEKDE